MSDNGVCLMMPLLFRYFYYYASLRKIQLHATINMVIFTQNRWGSTMTIQIYTMTHKKFEIPKDPLYVPLQVGRATKEDLGYLCDNTGDNISEKNCYYSELTGIYWIWKNVHDLDYVGVCHYRRYLINEHGKIFTRQELLEILQKVDVITTKRVKLRMPYYEGYKKTHHIENLDTTDEVIKELYPDYYPTFEHLIHGEETYFGNIMISKKEVFDSYAEWLFTIFFEVEKRVSIDSYDDYHKRVFGFISEILLLVWIRVNKLSVYECRVGMIGEKAETREMKKALAQYFQKKDVKGAKSYFLSCLQKRPDVLMEASDITGELKLCMQVIATCEQELLQQPYCILNEISEFHELMQFFHQLNHAVEHVRKNEWTKEDALFLTRQNLSEEAIQTAVHVLSQSEQEERETRKEITAIREKNKP